LRRRVLIVDDDSDSAESLALLLASMGHETRTAHDGLAAIELVRVFQPEAVLLDIGLPGMDGYETCRRMRQEPAGPSLFITAVTGWGQEEDRRRTREAGFDHHVVKPVDPATLMNLLQNLGGGQR
jgi:CheY-like chemotaxis protein